MRNIIKRVRDKIKGLEEGTVLYCWSGVFHDLEHSLVRGDQTFLNAIILRKGAPLFLRCPASICASGCDGREEPFVRYSLSTVYRVSSGDRKGKVVGACEIREDERYKDAGITKWLQMGRLSDCFSENRKGDVVICTLLDAFVDQDVVETRRVVRTAPLFYTCTTTLPRLRRDKNTLEFIRGFEHYDPILSLEQNARNLQDEIALDAAHNKKAFPFAFFYGRGVLAADFSDPERPFGQWCRIPFEEFADSSRAHIDIQI
jgi:hypothetical protein